MPTMSPDISRKTATLQQQSNGSACSIRLTVSVSVLQDVIKIKRLTYYTGFVRNEATIMCPGYNTGVNDNHNDDADMQVVQTT